MKGPWLAVAGAGAVALVAVLLLGLTGLFSSGGSHQVSTGEAAQAQGVAQSQGVAAGRVLSPAHGRGPGHVRVLPVVRLGLLAGAGGAPGLAAQGLGFFGQELGNGVQLRVTALGGPVAAQASALVAGRVDVAYMSPVAAALAWQETRGRVQVVSGVAVARPGGATTVVMVVSQGWAVAHPGWAGALLRAQVRAGLLLGTDPAAGRQAAEGELAVLAGRSAAATGAAGFAAVRFTFDPGEASVLAQARQAAAAGVLRPAGSLTGLFDVAPLDGLLRASGMAPVAS